MFHLPWSGEDRMEGGCCSRGLYPLHSGLVEPWSFGEKQARSGYGLDRFLECIRVGT